VPNSDVTRLLLAISGGEPDANERLYAVVYDELRRMAGGYLRRERADHTLSPTALVSEAYLKLIGHHSVSWEGRSHFFGVAAQAMRRILVDHARRRTAGKRSRHLVVTLEPDTPVATPTPPEEIVAVDEALQLLAEHDPRAARLVELRYFAGLTIEEAAPLLEISTATAKRDWMLARAWLQRHLTS
jgi:RNA polymerase sigma factor (TIGR02999 family)